MKEYDRTVQVSIGSIAVIGLGYVGLPLALLFAKKGFHVYGIDIDENKINCLLNGRSYIPDIADRIVSASLSSQSFEPVAEIKHASKADAVIICVPTPLTEQGTPDLSFLQKSAEMLGPHMRKDQLIVLESSTYPGTTREVLKPCLEQSAGMTAGTDFYIGYSPERIDPGNTQYDLEHIPKVVSGLTEDCVRKTFELYSSIFDGVVKVSSPEIAEMTKLLENSHRLINISFMIELAILCDEMKIDLWEVINAAATKPYGFTPFHPGPGIGGHCIPVDPLYLQWKAQSYGKTSRFIQLSDEVNKSVTQYIVNRVISTLKTRGITADLHILIYGVAYKKDVNDVRESPALELIKQFNEIGVHVTYHDPYIPEVKGHGVRLTSVELTDEALRSASCVLILTDHSAIPIERIVELAPFVFDTRNVTAGRNVLNNVARFGAGEY